MTNFSQCLEHRKQSFRIVEKLSPLFFGFCRKILVEHIFRKIQHFGCKSFEKESVPNFVRPKFLVVDVYSLSFVCNTANYETVYCLTLNLYKSVENQNEVNCIVYKIFTFISQRMKLQLSELQIYQKIPKRVIYKSFLDHLVRSQGFISPRTKSQISLRYVIF